MALLEQWWCHACDFQGEKMIPGGFGITQKDLKKLALRVKMRNNHRCPECRKHQYFPFPPTEQVILKDISEKLIRKHRFKQKSVLSKMSKEKLKEYKIKIKEIFNDYDRLINDILEWKKFNIHPSLITHSILNPKKVKEKNC